MGRRLAVDRIRCDGYGMCAELFPEGVALDDWGYPILRPGDIPDGLLSHARQAVDVCPALALRLVASPAVGSRVNVARGRERMDRPHRAISGRGR
jgi:ferredoxin